MRRLTRVARLALVASVLAETFVLGGCADDQRHTGDTGAVVSTETARIALAGAVDIRALGCRTAALRGAGAWIVGEHILTAAHVVSGATTITVRATPPNSSIIIAHVVAIDPVNDLALLDIATSSGGDLQPIPVATVPGVTDGRGGAVVFRDDAAVVLPFTIIKPVVVRILDIHHEHTVSRPGYEVDVGIAAGDSGAVMIGADGTAIGVIYALSRAAERRAFASDTGAVRDLIASAVGVDPTVGINTGDCV